MTRREAFQSQNAFGQEGQNVVMLSLLKGGCSVQKADADNWRDMVANIGGQTFRLEIKNEDRHQHTGNIAIETFQGRNKKPSGLSITSSDVWIHKIGAMCVAYRVPDMKTWLYECASIFKLSPKPFAGADGGCGGYVVPIRFLDNRSWTDTIALESLHTSKVFKKKIVSATEPDGSEETGLQQLDLFGDGAVTA